ncbi:hypothetical protein VP01_8936g1, partial [Puccinia sorghi]
AVEQVLFAVHVINLGAKAGFGAQFTCLEINVATRWNLTFAMFQPAIQLRASCDHFCKHNSEAEKFRLSPTEWNQASNLMKLLLPLSEATNMLCASRYSSLKKALRRGLYDQAQLIQPATQIVDKIEQYLLDAVKKTAYVSAMMLDPTFKISFWKKKKSFIMDYLHVS